MAARRTLLALALLGGSAAAYVARRRRVLADRVDVYFEDGSMVSLPSGAAAADRLLAIARGALR